MLCSRGVEATVETTVDTKWLGSGNDRGHLVPGDLRQQ